MELKPFAKTGRKLSDIGMGTYYDPLWIATAFLGWRRGSSTKVAAIEAGLGAGMTLIDTAEIYGSEPLVAEGIRSKKRDDLFIATKVWSNHLHRGDLIRALEKSLRRLGTTYVDLYQVHFPNSGVSIKETMGAMEEMVTAGKVLYVGVSNFSFEQIQEANSDLPKSQLSSVQLSYSLLNRAPESQILPYCRKEGIGFLAYYPLAHGKAATTEKLDGLCSKYGKTRSQVALRWLAQKEQVFPIPRASNPGHVLENAGASGWELSQEDVMALEAIFPNPGYGARL